MTNLREEMHKKGVEDFMQEALARLKSGASIVESRHIDELQVDLPDGSADQLMLTFGLFESLIERYKDDAKDLMAMAVITIEDASSIEPRSFQDLLDGQLKLAAPPELYLMA